MDDAVIKGYATAAPELILKFDAIDPAEHLSCVQHLFPVAASRILDVGGATGRTAAWLADSGHQVLVAEPVQAFRKAGKERHPSPRVEWLDDALPELAQTLKRRTTFDLILLSAVWHHLTSDQRKIAVSTMAALLAPGGTLIVSLRNGPCPAARAGFEAPPEELLKLASSAGLHKVFCQTAKSVQSENRKAGVTWVWLAFCR